ncbi:MAG: hypothetical protein RBT75_20475 [Anaerolineae bacterium]|jgi:hypothetical protein|nr:hypothetical protein [Anaerolineae bacterium]
MTSQTHYENVPPHEQLVTICKELLVWEQTGEVGPTLDRVAWKKHGDDINAAATAQIRHALKMLIETEEATPNFWQVRHDKLDKGRWINVSAENAEYWMHQPGWQARSFFRRGSLADVEGLEKD